MLYQLAKPFLFSMDAERAHSLALKSLQHLQGFMDSNMHYKPVKVMGLHFPNRVGLAAGFDKNGQAFESLFKCGFGHVEVGTLTPKPQTGNAKPRLFRLTRDTAIINRMGFNNDGVDAFLGRVKSQQRLGILGINIGKNKDTSEQEAVEDYLSSYRKIYTTADYVTINVSSPNTPNLRAFEQGELLGNLLQSLTQEKRQLEDTYQKQVPLVVKISPDLTEEELKRSAEVILNYNLDGIIATNTTLSREGLKSASQIEQGGLSGKALTQKSTQVVSQLKHMCGNDLAIIAAGGIMSVADAKDKIRAGADLVQVYTGFIYYGPSLVQKIASSI